MKTPETKSQEQYRMFPMLFVVKEPIQVLFLQMSNYSSAAVVHRDKAFENDKK